MDILVEKDNKINAFIEKHISVAPNGEFKAGNRAWTDNATQLADWTIQNIVNRDDTYVAYYQKKDKNGQITVHSARKLTANGESVPLTKEVLRGHYVRMGGDEPVGPYSFDPEGLGKWCCIDIDAHKEAKTDNWRDALHVMAILNEWKISPIIEHSNGKYGFHIWILFNSKVPCGILRSIGNYLVRDLPQVVEVFPKQASPTEFGSVVRLPGRHHKRKNWWSEFYDITNKQWLHGEDAVNYILNHQPNDINQVPEEVKAYQEITTAKSTTTSKSDDVTTKSNSPPKDYSRYTGHIGFLDIVALCADNGIELGKSSLKPNGSTWTEIPCPWREAHTTGETAYICHNADREPGDPSYPSFYCHHSHCHGRDLKDFLDIFSDDEVNKHCSKTIKQPEFQYDEDLINSMVQPLDLVASQPSVSDPTIDDDIPRKKESKKEISGFKFLPMSSAEFEDAVFKTEWLIPRVLVKDQPCIIGGPKKALKTSMLIDLALSLGSATPFLGKFKVSKKRRVVMISGESGNHTLQETAKRVCKSKGIRIRDTDTYWLDILPKLSVDEELNELQQGLAALQAEVVVIDPLYLCLLAGQGEKNTNAANLYDIGPLLLQVSRSCLEVGCTPILAHHAKKNLQFKSAYEPLDLDDLSFSGVQEFARQWLLLSRREAYVAGSGTHNLWLVAGGSCGQGGQWAVTVDEGQLADDFTGRTWQVTVDDMPTVILKQKEVKANKKLTAEQTENNEFLEKLDSLADIVSRTKFQKTVLGWSEAKYNRVEHRLVDSGTIQVTDHEFVTGQNAKRSGKMVVRCEHST